MLPPVKISIPRSKSGKLNLPAPKRPRLDNGDEPELLEGSTNGMEASAGEERFAKALNKITSVDGFEFRYTVGAPRNMPGFKEVDFLVQARGLVYPIEVDTEFTHRNKGQKDKLHDAILLNELSKQGMNVYPNVLHLDGESDLVSQDNADRTAKRLFQ